jgi:hypothetical protein
MLRHSEQEPYSGAYDLLLFDAGEDSEDPGRLLERAPVDFASLLQSLREERERLGATSFSILPLEMPFQVRTGLPVKIRLAAGAEPEILQPGTPEYPAKPEPVAEKQPPAKTRRAVGGEIAGGVYAGI